MFAVNVGVVGRPRVVDGDAAEAGQHAEVVDAFRAALGVTGDKGVLVGAGAVHPVQLARHSQPGLVETHHLGAGELVTHVGQKPVEAPGGPLGERGDGTTRQWGAEQFGQGLGGAFLGQELPDVQIHHDLGFGAGLANPSDDGGLLELPESAANRASNSAIRVRARCNSARVSISSSRSETTSAASTSYDGRGRSFGTNRHYDPDTSIPDTARNPARYPQLGP